MQLKFQSKNFLFFAILLAIETGIALFVHDQLIRPFVGDMLVIWLMVYFLRSFVVINHQVWFIAGVFLFACLIEAAQYFQILEALNLQGNRIITIVLGATFDWLDIAAYALGAVAILLVDYFQTRGQLD
jgi:hypothetical protein